MMTFRHYNDTDGTETFEARRIGQDPPKRQLKELQKLMAAMVVDEGQEIEATLIVRRMPRTKMRLEDLMLSGADTFGG
ncbi:hypothetical protein [Mycobacterium intracellulare]|uniref:Uncharacterized protein n=1 Tax=Mycobacterium intracellulare (strain ATCC 13950 / DSM 43223 / JCM 6384 / NCTC 13025 / 3600) TaxID=487521 RepID=H8IW53_MYCIA|nr:hypothetical protein [Mycobacterium intracellulare]AFC45937.1 hypothetical protein OCU_47180 [Mycobacterium intracellulare ATCC 13950]ETZ32344.1 hypothetical protein L843_5055 [Mycobacterium intracellulare MIN_061107_1834]MCA2276768.1 hypothetical protein [Mycobacterium intracellulare]MCA2328316.1 hypothetical protein [Mycobacterium intracellulare]UEB25363.1 hypothetical protein LK403_03760 [Mycobacterium intracellulare]